MASRAGSNDGIIVVDFEYIVVVVELNECSGQSGVTPELPEGIFHCVLTEDFPFAPRAFRGTPDSSYVQRGVLQAKAQVRRRQRGGGEK